MDCGLSAYIFAMVFFLLSHFTAGKAYFHV
jgi:hypothetical protein